MVGMEEEDILRRAMKRVRQVDLELMRAYNAPCVDCGLNTGSWCDGRVRVGIFDISCRAAHRVPTNKWMPNQGTPHCNECTWTYEICHFCRGASWATPPLKYMSTGQEKRMKFISDVKVFVEGHKVEHIFNDKYLAELSRAVPLSRLPKLELAVFEVYCAVRNMEDFERKIMERIVDINEAEGIYETPP